MESRHPGDLPASGLVFAVMDKLGANNKHGEGS